MLWTNLISIWLQVEICTVTRRKGRPTVIISIFIPLMRNIYIVFVGCPSTQNGSLYGSFASPGYPNNYPNNKRCSWGITVPSGYRIQLVFSELDTGVGGDWLKIFDGPSSSSKRIASLSGLHSPPFPGYRSSGSSLWFEFSSDDGYTRRGFHANYTAIPPHSGMWTDLINIVLGYKKLWLVCYSLGNTLRVEIEEGAQGVEEEWSGEFFVYWIDAGVVG